MKKKYLMLLLILALFSCVSCSKENEPISQIDGKPKVTQMKAICELATLECYYHNVAKYTEEDASGILFWTKDRKFWVEYSGIVKIGIDASTLDLEIKDDTVTITIPKAKILSTKVDESSLTENSFYIDSDSAEVDAESQTAAYKEAEKKMREKAESDTALLTNAQQRAQSLLEDYVTNLGNVIGKNYKIMWKTASEK